MSQLPNQVLLDAASRFGTPLYCYDAKQISEQYEKLKTAFAPHIGQIRETQDLQEAVSWAQQLAEDKEVVLLSPACASFDLFKNYEDRGDQFKAAVLALTQKQSA